MGKALQPSERLDRYVHAVTTGNLDVCKWTRLAVERHVRDMGNALDGKSPYAFDRAKADRACRFIENLPHVKGEWALPDPRTGKQRSIILEDWQCFVIGSIFGWVSRETGMRRFRSADVFLPRKNTKSTMAAGIGLYMLSADGEPGAEVYCGAVSKAQAMEVFRPARQMCLREPELPEQYGIEVNASSLVIIEDNARFEPVVGRPRDGASPHCAIIDEYHQHKDSALYNSMRTGMGARRQPLLLVISTAGDDMAGPCREEWGMCERLLSGAIEDDSLFAIIYSLDAGEDWTSEIALRKANPNWGVSVNPVIIRADQRTAIQDANKQADFQTKHLNLWVGSVSGYYNMETWACLKNEALKIEQFNGKPCIISCDFASHSDLVVSLKLFPNGAGFVVFCDHYLPRATVDLPQNKHYRNFERNKWLHVTEGNRTDLSVVVDDLCATQARVTLLHVFIDPTRVYGVATTMMDRGLPVMEMRTGRGYLSRAVRFLEDLMKDGKISHNGDPVLAWAMSNIVAKADRRDQLYVTKESEDKKIDPAVALLMCLAWAMDNPFEAPSFGISW